MVFDHVQVCTKHEQPHHGDLEEVRVADVDEDMKFWMVSGETEKSNLIH